MRKAPPEGLSRNGEAVYRQAAKVKRILCGRHKREDTNSEEEAVPFEALRNSLPARKKGVFGARPTQFVEKGRRKDGLFV